MKGFKNYYEVIAKCGHVGKMKYVPIKFSVIAETAEEAASLVRYFPRVKHNLKSAILSVTKIDRKRFLEIKEINDNDPYLQCSCKRDQIIIGSSLEERIENYEWNYKEKIPHKEYRFEKIVYKNKKNKEIERCYIKETYYENIY